MADHDPKDETVLRNPIDVVAAIFDLEPSPAAPISAEEIAEMRARINAASPLPWRLEPEVCDHCTKNGTREWSIDGVSQGFHGMFADEGDAKFLFHSRSDMPRLLDAIEALTAFRADALDTFRAIGLALGLPDPLAADAPADCPAVWEGKLSEKVAAVVAQCEALTAGNARLTSENTELRLQCLSHEGQAHSAYEAQKRAEAENSRLAEFALNASVGHGWKDRAERAEAEVERLTDKLGKYAMPPWEADACKREAMAARRALCLGEHNPNVAPADIYDRIVALRTANETRQEDVR
jgi:hypothetical protein